MKNKHNVPANMIINGQNTTCLRENGQRILRNLTLSVPNGRVTPRGSYTILFIYRRVRLHVRSNFRKYFILHFQCAYINNSRIKQRNTINNNKINCEVSGGK